MHESLSGFLQRSVPRAPCSWNLIQHFKKLINADGCCMLRSLSLRQTELDVSCCIRQHVHVFSYHLNIM